MPPTEPHKELGDLDSIDFNRPQHVVHRGGFGWVPWMLLVLVLGGGAGLYLRMVRPMEMELADARQLVRETRKANANLDEEVNELVEARAELQATRAALAEELEAKQAELEQLQVTRDELEGKLKTQIDEGNVAIREAQGQLVVDLRDRILFDSGQAELNEEGREVLTQMGDTLQKLKDKVIQVGGHTDAMKISPKLQTQFPTNWELSSARALTVVRFLNETIEIPGERLAAVGFSQYWPIASNASRTGRRRNRRIELVLMPKPPPRTEPK